MAHKKGNVAVLAAHLAVGQPLTAAARAAGMSERTARRRMQEDETQAAIRGAYLDLARIDTGRFRDLRNQAQDRLGEALAAGDASPQLVRLIEVALKYSAASDSAWTLEMIAAQLTTLTDIKEELQDELRELDEIKP